MNDVKRLYIFSATLSCCCHVVMLHVLNTNYIFPSFAPSRTHAPVALELVDNRKQPEEKSDVDSHLIDEEASKSKDYTLSKKKGLFPASDSTGRVKSISDQPFSKAVDGMPKTQGAQVKHIPHELPIEDGVLLSPREHDATLDRKIRDESKSTTQAARIANEKSRMYNNVQSEVEELGDPSFATQKDKLAPYLKAMRHKIFEEWFLLVSLRAGVMTYSQVVIEFKIVPEGDIIDMHLRSHQGSDVFPDLCMAAIRKAAPFGRIPIEFPEYLKEHHLVIKFNFFYN